MYFFLSSVIAAISKHHILILRIDIAHEVRLLKLVLEYSFFNLYKAQTLFMVEEPVLVTQFLFQSF